MFKEYYTVDWGKGPKAASAVREALSKALKLAKDWAGSASTVLKAIEKMGPQSDKVDVVLVYACVVTEAGDDGPEAGTIVGHKTVLLEITDATTNALALDFQKGGDAAIRPLVNKPRGEMTKQEIETYLNWSAKVFEKLRPKGECCSHTGAI